MVFRVAAAALIATAALVGVRAVASIFGSDTANTSTASSADIERW